MQSAFHRIALNRRSSQSLRAGLTLSVAIMFGSACAEPRIAPATPTYTAPVPTEPEKRSYTFAPPDVRISPRIPGTLPEGVDFHPDLVLVSHARDEAPWAIDSVASEGLKILAETGISETLAGEAESAGMLVHARSFAELLQVFMSPDPSFEFAADRPCLSYAQMIAPSADWFIGFTNICMTDENGYWLPEISAELLAYDAGTGEGEDYEYKSGDTEPRQPISLLDRPPFFAAPAVVQVFSISLKDE